MSTQDRRAEREVADFYDASVRPPVKQRQPRAVKRFAEALADGLALGAIWHKLRP